MAVKRICVIGAGPSGLAAAKNAVPAGLQVTVYEMNDKVGGNWVFNSVPGHSSVCENTHIISSKALSEFEDFPMPPEYPEYPRHDQIRAYFESYARHFGVLPKIRFKHRVTKCVRLEQGNWQIDFTDAEGQDHCEIFDVLMVANGHHWSPKFPEYEGKFSGVYWPLADYQAMLACAEIDGRYRRPLDIKARIQAEMANPHYRFDGGSRHSTQVDYRAMRNELKSDLATIGIDIGKPPMGMPSHYKKWTIAGNT